MEKQVNEKTTREFNQYMIEFQNELKKTGNYRKRTTSLIKEYYSSDSGRSKLEIKNELAIINIRLAYKILFKKLKVNIFRSDILDIFQEFNLCLLESVEEILSKLGEEEVINSFSARLYYKLLGKLCKITRNYFDYNNRIDYIEFPDNIILEEKEDVSDLIYEINSTRNSVLSTREQQITDSYLKGDISYCSLNLDLTIERIQQIKNSSLRKIRDSINEKHQLTNKLKLEKELLLKFIKRYPRRKYILFAQSKKLTMYQSGSKNYEPKQLDVMVDKGLNPSEWIIITDRYVSFTREEYDGFLQIVSNLPFEGIHNRNLIPIDLDPLEMFPLRDLYISEFRNNRKMYVDKSFELLSENEINDIYRQDKLLMEYYNKSDFVNLIKRKREIISKVISYKAMVKYWLLKHNTI